MGVGSIASAWNGIGVRSVGMWEPLPVKARQVLEARPGWDRCFLPKPAQPNGPAMTMGGRGHYASVFAWYQVVVISCVAMLGALVWSSGMF